MVNYSKQLCVKTQAFQYEEPSPNSFSFNSPYGACPICKGLGNVFTIDMDLVIPDKSKTFDEGAHCAIGRRKRSICVSTR